jgi:hypothetical protein
MLAYASSAGSKHREVPAVMMDMTNLTFLSLAANVLQELPGTHFTCFTGTKVQILSLFGRQRPPGAARYSLYLLYWYKSTNTDAQDAARKYLNNMQAHASGCLGEQAPGFLVL